jgi:hypothetical protein
MKIALINSLFFDKDNRVNNNILFELSKYFFITAKKNFLIEFDVDYTVITNNINKVDLDYINHIYVDINVEEYQHKLLMKILCLQYLNKQYDYIFIADADHIVINKINKSDLLYYDFVSVEHFFNADSINILKELTNNIEIKFNNKNNIWYMGNFYGGKRDILMKLLNNSLEIHKDMYQKYSYKESMFYGIYPDEIFINKFIHENNFSFKSLTSSFNFDEKKDTFLGDFSTKYENIINFKLLHDTKKDFEFLRNIIKKYE